MKIGGAIATTPAIRNSGASHRPAGNSSRSGARISSGAATIRPTISLNASTMTTTLTATTTFTPNRRSIAIAAPSAQTLPGTYLPSGGIQAIAAICVQVGAEP